MEQLYVGGDYDEMLKQLQPAEYVRPARPGTFEAAAPFYVPPLNTDIRFSAALPPKHLDDQAYLTVAALPLPDTWDWRHEYDDDDDATLDKKDMLTVVPNQGLCGSCWAVAVAGLVGDLFVTAGIVDENPVVSATYSLACYPQYQCGGGNPAELLGAIQEKGVASDKCVDYSWCNSDDMCFGKSTQHFNAAAETGRLNALIPPCGCRGSDATEHALYYVKDPQVMTAENDAHDIGPAIRSHIYNVGPVIGGYHVFKNFMVGDYTATNGVYFERYDYAADRWLTPAEGPQWVGSHAVVVIGWGVTEPMNVPTPDGRERDVAVPYWYCRNSWGHKWGIDSGYFRIAAYPFNLKSQFERSVVIQPQNMMSGGFMLCYPDRVVVSDKLRNVLRVRRPSDDLVAAAIYGREQPAHWRVWVLLATAAAVVAAAVYFARRRHR